MRPPASPVGSVLSDIHSMNPSNGESSSIVPGSEKGSGAPRFAGAFVGAAGCNEWIETLLPSMPDDTRLRLTVEQAMGRRRVCRCHQRPSPRQSDRHSCPASGPPHRPLAIEMPHGKLMATPLTANPGCSTRHSTDEWMPGLGRGDAGADRSRFGATRPRCSSRVDPRSGQFFGRPATPAGQEGLIYLDRNHALGHAADRKMRAAGLGAATILPTGAHRKGRNIMKSTCNN